MLGHVKGPLLGQTVVTLLDYYDFRFLMKNKMSSSMGAKARNRNLFYFSLSFTYCFLDFSATIILKIVMILSSHYGIYLGILHFLISLIYILVISLLVRVEKNKERKQNSS